MSVLNNLLGFLKEEENNLLTIKKQLIDSEQRVKGIQSLIFCEKSGLKVGDVVTYQGKQYKFLCLESYDSNIKYCWIKGNLIKKDGSVSDVEKSLYGEWVKV